MDGTVTFKGSLENAVGTVDHPLYLLYVNNTDADQVENVRIDLVLGYE